MNNVAVLTLRLGENYGGILQAYALQHVIREMGHNVEISWSDGPVWKYALKRVPGLQKMFRVLTRDSRADDTDISQSTGQFIKRNMQIVPFWRLLTKSAAHRYDTFLVGSDQVWRSEYAHIPHYLLNFCPKSCRRVSFAASFGKDGVAEYGGKLISRSRSLASRFDHISVREDSGVDIVRECWGLEAEHHLDPTMMVSPEHYRNIVETSKLPLLESQGRLFRYILDYTEEKKSIVDSVSEICGIDQFSIISGDRNNGNTLPSVSQWLKCFIDADYVVTDSFHGTVFSLIFNKPFLVVGNPERGLSRLTSLLRTFCLQDRLVTSVDSVTNDLIFRSFPWETINGIIRSERTRSMEFLTRALS